MKGWANQLKIDLQILTLIVIDLKSKDLGNRYTRRSAKCLGRSLRYVFQVGEPMNVNDGLEACLQKFTCLADCLCRN